MDIDEVRKEYEARIAELNNRISELEAEIEIYNIDNKTLREERDRFYDEVIRGQEILKSIQKLVDIYLHNELIIPKIEFERKFNNATIKSPCLNDILSSREAMLDIYIENFDLRVATKYCLRRVGVYTVRDLLGKFKNRDELLGIHSLSIKRADEIIQVLAENGVDVTQYEAGE